MTEKPLKCVCKLCQLYKTGQALSPIWILTNCEWKGYTTGRGALYICTWTNKQIAHACIYWQFFLNPLYILCSCDSAKCLIAARTTLHCQWMGMIFSEINRCWFCSSWSLKLASLCTPIYLLKSFQSDIQHKDVSPALLSFIELFLCLHQFWHKHLNIELHAWAQLIIFLHLVIPFLSTFCITLCIPRVLYCKQGKGFCKPWQLSSAKNWR